jgi:hypothetical protein
MLKFYLQLVGIRRDIASLLKIYLHLVATKWFNGFLFDVYLQLMAIKFVAMEIDLAPLGVV